MTDTARLTAALAGRYRIERELGAGGMATVYLAYDIRHDRNVALKVLRPELAAVIGADRFLKEIKVTAHLQHPHILGLIDSGEADGLLYYVMPFVEGESLRDRITHEKQLPVEDAVRITCEVASALDYAHRHGVIHRDIKPENILLHEGQTMVADFGIALAVSAGAGTRMTETGMSLGTPHYMSPEQAMGERELTARSDVYALGAVLYELLVGEPPFTGPTAQAIVAKVVTEAPRPLIPQRHTVPPHVEAAVLMALEKLPADRFAGAAAFAEALAHPSIMAVRGARMAVRESRPWDLRQWRRLTVAVAVLAVASGGLAGWGWLRGREPAAVSRFPLVLEGEYAQALHIVAVSPDGAHIAYVNDSVDRLFVRDRDRLESSPIPDGETGDTPFFSPDGEQVAFCSGTPGALRAASLTGGAGRVLVRDSAYAAGGTWSNDGWIYFVGGAAQALLRVRAEGGKPELVARPDTAHDELFFNRPQILPGDRTALVTIWRRRGATDIAAVDIATGKTTVLTRGVEAQYARSGHLIVLAADGSVQAVRFDAGHLTLIGRPMTVLDGVAVGSEVEGASAFALSNTGTFIYQTALPKQQVMRVPRDGRAQPVDTGWSGHFRQSDLSPDGTRLAITVLRGERAEVWVKALGTGTLTRLQYEGTYNYRPTWTPDGRSLLFISDRSGHAAAYRVLADGSAPATLLRDDPSRALDEASLSRDGRWLVYRTESGVGRDIYAIRPGIDSMPTPIATSPFEEYAPTLSPDGRWVAYTSQESGQPEIFVRPFPNAQAARWQISRAGGSEPVWARSGRELFYRNAASDLVAAEVATRPPFRVVAEHVLFSTRDYVSDAYNRAFTVSPDDRSFLFVRPRPGAQSQLIMVTNWFEELKAKVGK